MTCAQPRFETEKEHVCGVVVKVKDLGFKFVDSNPRSNDS